MFGQNEIVGRSFFKDAPANSLLVTSLFFTIQGEGPFRGEPAFFLRLAKCNLACSFCDTFFDQGTWMTFQEIDAAIEQTLGSYFDFNIPAWADGAMAESGQWIKARKMILVITGGEPALQRVNLNGFISYTCAQFDNVQIESNGSVNLQIDEPITIVVSPKCNVADHYILPSSYTLWAANCLKFVVSADPSSPYFTIPLWAQDWARQTGKKIFISPMNIYNTLPQKAKELRATKQSITLEERSTADEVISFWEPGLLDMKANQANHEYAAKYSLQHGYTFNLQIHLFASMA